jgi:hypothetical protein
MDPNLISSALEMKPYREWKAGHQRMTRTGQLLQGVYSETYWCSEGVRGEGFDLASTLESELEKMEGKRAFFGDFCSTGGEIEIYIGWFTGEKNTGEVFGWELLKRFAAMQIGLALDVYGGRDPGQKVLVTPSEKKSSEP